MTIFSACFSAASVKVTVKVYKNDMEQNFKKYIRILMLFFFNRQRNHFIYQLMDDISI